MEFGKLFELFIAAALINNFVFTRYLGLCIFFGVTKKMDTSIGMSITFTSVMVISAALNWIIYKFIMIPLGLGFLEIVIFIGVVAGFVQAADTIMKKVSPGLYYKLGIYLALITTNCIILAVPLLNVSEGYNFIESMFFGFGSGVGFSLAMIIMASIRGKTGACGRPEGISGTADIVHNNRLDCAGISGVFRADYALI